MPYIGNQPGTGVRSRFIYTATASQTTFSGADDNSKTLSYADSNYIDVYLNGVCLEPGTDYTASTKTSVVLTQAASLGDTLKVIAYDVASMDDSISKADGGTFESSVTFADGADIITASKGTDNVRIGEDAGASIISGGNNNVLVGKDAGTAITTGDDNVAVGRLALDANTTGQRNVAVGNQALSTETQGRFSTAVGYSALEATNSTSTVDTYNVGIGYKAGEATSTGVKNTFVGGLAGLSNVGASNNTAVGFEALTNNTTASENTAVGYEAAYTNTTGANNSVFGWKALYDNTTGSKNVAFGLNAGASNTTGTNNTFVGAPDSSGFGSGHYITTGSKNTILGAFDGNQNGLDIRTSSNAIVLSDGDGLPKMFHDGGVNWFIGNYTSNAYWPAAASSSSQHGILFQNTTGALGVSTNDAIYFNKNNGDGTIVLFYSEGGLEGSISISGSTTSFNGGHLSRWSQLADGSRDNALVKGTVMTNLDQMAVWEHDAVAEGDTIKNAMGETVTATADDVADAYTEDNEQLNCMAVSSVEGDANVAGVFVNWDATDDGYNDMNIAMTGDMVIRIAQGTTVARGDLLMSAGDGTAKPQGDDIVRSKTIAKVTSTNVSHTYDDGSYLVPCVLMAC